jgi:uncharacterized protein
MIDRRIIVDINDSLDFFPMVSIAGTRQVGKTTLAKHIIDQIDKPVLFPDLYIQSYF